MLAPDATCWLDWLVAGVGRKPVDRFRRYADKPPGLECRNGLREFRQIAGIGHVWGKEPAEHAGVPVGSNRGG